MIWPVINMFRISATDWGSIAASASNIGLQNYSAMLSDPRVHTALRNTIVYAVIAVPGVAVLAFMLGYYLSNERRGHTVLKVVFFTPALISAAAQAMIFLSLFQPRGIINGVLTSTGLESLVRPWLADSATALPVIISIHFWGGIGFWGVVYAAALTAVPRDLYSAARLDGASSWNLMWRVAFPYVRGFFGLGVALSFLFTLTGSAQLVLLLTKGGPADASLTLGYYLYDQAFVSSRIGYSQAIGVVLFFAGIVGMLVIRRVLRPTF